jgi:hypothetical protein
MRGLIRTDEADDRHPPIPAEGRRQHDRRESTFCSQLNPNTTLTNQFLSANPPSSNISITHTTQQLRMAPPHEYEVDLRALNSSSNSQPSFLSPLIEYFTTTLPSTIESLPQSLTNPHPIVIFLVGCIFRSLAAYLFDSEKAIMITIGTGLLVWYLMRQSSTEGKGDYNIVGIEGKKVASELGGWKAGKEELRKTSVVPPPLSSNSSKGKKRIHGLDDTTVQVKNGRAIVTQPSSSSSSSAGSNTNFSTMDTLESGNNQPRRRQHVVKLYDGKREKNVEGRKKGRKFEEEEENRRLKGLKENDRVNVRGGGGGSDEVG